MPESSGASRAVSWTSDDLRRERSGPQVDAGDRMPEREPRGDGAADPARRAGDEDLHVVLKLTRRPTRQVSS